LILFAIGGLGAFMLAAAVAALGWHRFAEWRRSERAQRHREAMEQLARPEPELRIAGVYALERHVRDAPREAGVVLDELCAFIRLKKKLFDARVDEDVQVALRAISRIVRDSDAGLASHVALHDAHLAGARLAETWFRGADLRRVSAGSPDPLVPAASFRKADLRGCALCESNLVWVNFWRANLRGADLRNAILISAFVVRADLRGADLRGADLRAARVDDAKLQRARLQGADLSTATGLTQEQVDRAFVDHETRLPPGIRRRHLTIWDVLRVALTRRIRVSNHRIRSGDQESKVGERDA
jgi:hypothetical protein